MAVAEDSGHVMRSEASLRWGGERFLARAEAHLARMRDRRIPFRARHPVVVRRATRLIARDVLAEQGRSASFPRAPGAVAPIRLPPFDAAIRASTVPMRSASAMADPDI